MISDHLYDWSKTLKLCSDYSAESNERNNFEFWKFAARLKIYNII